MQRFVRLGKITGKLGATGHVSNFGVLRGKSEAKPDKVGGPVDFVDFDGRWVQQDVDTSENGEFIELVVG